MSILHQIPVITIDGPSGVGKSTMAVRLAQTLGWHYLNSGAIYRLLALKIQTSNALFGNAHPVLELPTIHGSHVPQNAIDVCQAIVNAAKNLNIHFQGQDSYLDNQNVTEAIRQENIGLLASKFSAIPEVRAALLERQRAFAQAPGLVTDGRDMGSVVFPNALAKFYLDAAPEIRAKRREAQLKAQGIHVTFADLLLDIQKRDQQDKSRVIAPLVVPEGGVVIDTGSLSQAEVFEKMLSEVRKRLAIGGI